MSTFTNFIQLCLSKSIFDEDSYDQIFEAFGKNEEINVNLIYYKYGVLPGKKTLQDEN